MDIQKAISALSRSGWSQRRIARELGVDRETVARYRRLARQATQANAALAPTGSEAAGPTNEPALPKPAISPAGAETTSEANPAIAPTGSGAFVASVWPTTSSSRGW